MNGSTLSATHVSMGARVSRLGEALRVLQERGVFAPSIDAEERGARLKDAMVALGPTAVKLGQFLGQRPDIVGSALASELESLHHDVPAAPPEAVRRVLARELGGDWADRLQHFDETPLAAGSIGQVHTARLADGARVAVKVQREGIVDVCHQDLAMLDDLAQAWSWIGPPVQVSVRQVVRQFRASLLDELDYRIEADHLRHAGCTLEAQDVRVPEVVDDLTTGTVLTMTLLDGRTLASLDDAERARLDGAALAKVTVRAYVAMIRDGRFHADPHPGNLMVRPDGGLALVDFGMVGTLDRATRSHVMRALTAFVERDEERLTRAALALCEPASPRLDESALLHDVRHLMHEHGAAGVSEVPVAELLTEALSVLQAHGMVLQPSVALLVKCVVSLQGSARTLDADYAVFDAIEDGTHPLNGVGVDFGLPGAWLGEMGRSLQALTDLPSEAELTLEQVRRGGLRARVSLEGLDGAVHHLTWATVSAALLLGGCVLLAARVPPSPGDISVFGVVLLVLGGTSSVAILLSMLRHHRTHR